MYRTLALLSALSVSSLSYGACIQDSYELGDIGPDSRIVCKALDSKAGDIKIVSRAIQAADAVTVTVDVDGQTQALDYKLVGANWKLAAAN